MTYRRFLRAAGLLVLTACLTAAWAVAQTPASPHHEVRAVWLTTIGGLDWPSQPATTEAGARRQQQELCRQLDALQRAGFNTVLFQTRIRATTAYPSAIEPWDEVFSGRPGVAPPYDPLAFAIAEAHRRGMELHAWVVAYPAGKVEAVRRLGAKALPRRHPELCRRSGDQWMMDPGAPGTAAYIAGLCAEIVRRYDVDGIHLDYIRYPEKEIPFDDRTTYRRYGRGVPRAAWRRANVTRTVRAVRDSVKSLKPWVRLSCSPVGKHADLPRYSSYGWNARDAVAQDAQAWLQEGLMDMLFPMMYFRGNHFYPFALDWQEAAGGRPVVPGLGTYMLAPGQKDWPLLTLRREMNFLRRIGSAGQAHFRARFVLDNVKGVYGFLANDFYRQPALVPSMTWADSVAPVMAGLSLRAEGHALHLAWPRATDPTPGSGLSYNVYRLPADGRFPEGARLLARALTDTAWSFVPLPPGRHARYAVTAVDRFGNESRPATASLYAATPPETPVTMVDNGRLCLPDADAEYALITDIAGRALCTFRYDTLVALPELAPGYYEVRTLDRKGISHKVARFGTGFPFAGNGTH